jgi:hypothetical protein
MACCAVACCAQVELLHSREKGDSDHEILRLTYPYQPNLRDWGKESEAAQRSFFSMPAPMFYELHPFHIIMDSQLRLLQWGAAIGRVVTELRVGLHLSDFFRVRTGCDNQASRLRLCDCVTLCDRKTVRLQDCKTARLWDRKTVRLQDCETVFLLQMTAKQPAASVLRKLWCKQAASRLLDMRQCPANRFVCMMSCLVCTKSVSGRKAGVLHGDTQQPDDPWTHAARQEHWVAVLSQKRSSLCDMHMLHYCRNTCG